MNKVKQQYEDNHYTFGFHKTINIDHLYGVSKLLGVPAVNPAAAKVLEIGCHKASDLIAMATRFPKSSFKGFDFTEAAIKEAQSIVCEVGLQNIELEVADILTWKLSTEDKYDYIIAHGFLSWVPDEVKERLFAVYNSLLSPNGIGLISYSAKPGSQVEESLRDYMLLKSDQADSSFQKIADAKCSVRFLIQARQALPNVSTGDLVLEKAKMALAKQDNFIIHDDLGDIRDSYYLMEFASFAMEHGLSYVGDSELSSTLVENLPSFAAKELVKQGLSQLEVEQTLDFIINRGFRTSLVRLGADEVCARLNAYAFRELSISSSLRYKKKKSNGSLFLLPQGGKVTLKNSFLTEFLIEAGRYPQGFFSYEELLSVAVEKVGREPTESEQEQLDEGLMTLYTKYGVEVLGHPIKPTLAPPVKPKLSKFNLFLVREHSLVVQQDLGSFIVPEELRELVLLFDGEHCIEDIRLKSQGGQRLKGLNRLVAAFLDRGILKEGEA